MSMSPSWLKTLNRSNFPSSNILALTKAWTNIYKHRCNKVGKYHVRIGGVVMDAHLYDILHNTHDMAPLCLGPKVELRDSAVHGRGVFLTQDVEQNEVVTFYGADVIVLRQQVDARVVKGIPSRTLEARFATDELTTVMDEAIDYQFDISPDVAIRGSPRLQDVPQCLGHFINDGCPNPFDITQEEYERTAKDWCNCHHEIMHMVAVVMSKPQKKGTELVTQYGYPFWADQKRMKDVVFPLPVPIPLRAEEVRCCTECGNMTQTNLRHCANCHKVYFCSEACRAQNKHSCKQQMETCFECTMRKDIAKSIAARIAKQPNPMTYATLPEIRYESKTHLDASLVQLYTVAKTNYHGKTQVIATIPICKAWVWTVLSLSQTLGNLVSKVCVKKSTLRNAGDGLFATELLPQGAAVTCYPVHALVVKHPNSNIGFDTAPSPELLAKCNDDMKEVSRQVKDEMVEYQFDFPGTSCAARGHPEFADVPQCLGHKINDGTRVDPLSLTEQQYIDNIPSAMNCYVKAAAQNLRLVVYASRDIQSGEELFTSYGYQFWIERRKWLNKDPAKHFCMVCSLPATLRCTKCKKVRYCNKQCQKNHWTFHKTVCVA